MNRYEADLARLPLAREPEQKLANVVWWISWGVMIATLLVVWS